MINLHISLTEFRNESRAIKEAASIMKLGVFDTVYILALHAADLKINESFGPGVRVHRIKLISRCVGKGLFFQLIQYIEFSFRVFLFCRNKKIRMLNIHSIALLPLGYFIKLLRRCRLIYDTHELETETKEKSYKKRFLIIAERLFIYRCDKVFVVSESIADWYANKYNIEKPIVVMNVPVVSNITKTNYFRDHFGISESQRIILYQGGLSPGRGVELLLNAFKQRVGQDAVIIFMGYGPLDKEIKQGASMSDLVFFHKAVPPHDLLTYTAAADIGISYIQNTCLSYYYCMPNKLFEYMMAGLPVLVSNMKEMSSFVTQYKVGVIIKEESPEAINQAIDEMLAMDLSEMKTNARNAAVRFSWDVQERKMLQAYRTMFNTVKMAKLSDNIRNMERGDKNENISKMH